MKTTRSLFPLILLLAMPIEAARAQEAPKENAPAAAPVPVPEAPPSLREEDVLLRWLKNSPEVASWRTQIGSARFDVVAARVWPNPELQLNGQGKTGGATISGLSSFGAQITAPVPIFGQIGARGEAAEALVSVAEVTVMQTLWSRAADIESAMVARAFADARLRMLQKNLQEVDRIEKIVGLRTAAGASSEYDVLRVTTSTATLRGAVNTAIIDRDRAESNVIGLVADPSLTVADVTREGLASFRGPEDLTGLVNVALKRRPDLELARRGVVAFEASARRYRRDAYPIPGFFVAGQQSQGPESFYLTAGVNLPLPVFDRNRGQIGRALSDAQGQQFLAQALETRVRAEVSGSWRARQNARAALAQFRERSMLAATELLRRAEVTYQAGKFSITELFDAYSTMWDARSQELDLERQMAEAEADLEHAAVLVPLDLPAAR